MKIAICDDEKVFRDNLKNALNDYSNKSGQNFIYYEYSDGKSLLTDNRTYDLIFMDYQMQEMNGIDVIDIIRKRNDNTAVIFISSYKEKVFDSLKVQTYRFLVKPLNIDKLYEALNAFILMYNKDKFLLLRNDKLDIMERVYERSVIYAEADNMYCKIRTYDNTYVLKKTLSSFEEALQSDFFYRVHRSYLVNLKYILNYSQSEILLENNEKALLAKNRYHKFQKAYIEYLKRSSMGIMK